MKDEKWIAMVAVAAFAVMSGIALALHLPDALSDVPIVGTLLEGKNVIRKTTPLDAPELSDAFSGESDDPIMTNDSLRTTFYSLLAYPQGEKHPITFDLSVIDELAETRRDLLIRYLATNPAWKLYNHKFYGLTASRRIMRDGVWYDANSGSMKLGRLIGRRFVRCDVRVEIAFGGRVSLPDYVGRTGYKTEVKLGEKRCVAAGRSNDRYVSQVTARGSKVVVAFEEEQGFSDNRFIAATVACLRKEFQDLMSAKDWDEAVKLLPKWTVSYSGTSLRVYHNGIGEYQCYVRVNPGEEGFVYIRVADPETGKHYWMTESHRPPIKTRSSEYVGWSKNTNETFFASTAFTMYDGQYGNPAPVNVEVWFSPKTGGKDRKLTEQIFNLEAWER